MGRGDGMELRQEKASSGCPGEQSSHKSQQALRPDSTVGLGREVPSRECERFQLHHHMHVSIKKRNLRGEQ